MKTIKLIVVMAILLVVIGCNEETCRPTAWIITGSDLDARDNPITGRVGVNSEGVEFGVELNYAGGHLDHKSYGAYIMGEFAPTVAGTPYMGYHAVLAMDDVKEQHGPILGTLIQITPRVATVIEGQYIEQAASSDQYRAFAGIRAKF